MAKTATPSPRIVRALDIGWGHTKLSRLDPVLGVLEYLSFPSLAPRHVEMGLQAGLSGKRDTKVVYVDGTAYEVGPDSTDLDSGEATRNLNDQYILTEQYKAVFYGALAYMRDTEPELAIDLLVVGLPLSNMRSAAKLRDMMVGAHTIAPGQTVEVKDALVLPQPYGGYKWCESLADQEPAFAALSDETVLVVDPGYLTFDYLLVNNGRVVENRSGAHNGGVSKVLRAIADSISSKYGITYGNLSAIDRGLKRRTMKVSGKVEPLDEHIRNTRGVVEGAVSYMKNIVGDGSDIDTLILLGGGGPVYQKTLAAAYPAHTVHTVDNPSMANVKGFQLAGEALTKDLA